MIQPKTAQNIILKYASRRKICRPGVDSALNRVLAEDIYALCDGPQVSKSTVDGFAVNSHDIVKVPLLLRVIESISAGTIPRQRLKKGECSKIATGAMLPPGADAVVMKENTQLLSNHAAKILNKIRRWDNIHQKAQDFKKGALILKKGSVLNVAKVALLASVGMTKVKVFDAPRVAILSTGDEVKEPGSKKRKSDVWNSSRTMLTFALRSMHIEPRYLGIAKDEMRQVSKKIKAGLICDVLIITGAVSVGELDLIPAALKKMGILPIFHKVCLKPGKPLLFARSGSRLIFGLPGNPVSTMVGFFLFVKPALLKMLGQEPNFIIEEGVLSKEVYNKSGRVSLMPARLERRKNEDIIHPIRFSGSADLSAIAKADAFFILGRKQIKAFLNSRVKFLRIS